MWLRGLLEDVVEEMVSIFFFGLVRASVGCMRGDFDEEWEEMCWVAFGMGLKSGVGGHFNDYLYLIRPLCSHMGSSMRPQPLMWRHRVQRSKGRQRVSRRERNRFPYPDLCERGYEGCHGSMKFRV